MPERDLSTPITHSSAKVKERWHGTRLDRFLALRFRWGSRTYFVERIEAGEVTVNGAVCRKHNQKLREGDVVSVRLAEDVRRVVRLDLDVLYEDETIIVLNKQPGQVVHPAGRHLNDTIMNSLHARFRRPDDPSKDVVPRLVHRLDKDTTGVLLIGKREEAIRDLTAQFRDHGKLEKEYRVIVRGEVENDTGMIDAPIGRDPGDPKGMRRCVTPEGAPSRTAYRVLERFEGFVFLAVQLFTGRQHQIRVHMLHLGSPVACDELYTGVRSVRVGNATLERMALHHARLGVRHPATGKAMVFEAPLPPDMEDFLSALRRQA